jgi:hypothetical protein
LQKLITVLGLRTGYKGGGIGFALKKKGGKLRCLLLRRKKNFSSDVIVKQFF